MTDSMFGAGRRTTVAPIATSMRASTGPAIVLVDHQIRCSGIWRGRACNKLLAERAGRPHTHVCSRCGFRNDIPLVG